MFREAGRWAVTRHMATAVTTDTLRALAGFRAETGCAVSLYLDLSPSSTPTIPDVETKFNSLLSKAQKLADRNGVKVDLERIREWWDAEFDHDGARGPHREGENKPFRQEVPPEVSADAARRWRTPRARR